MQFIGHLKKKKKNLEIIAAVMIECALYEQPGKKIWLRLVLSPPPLFFYRQYVFPMYILIIRLFSSMAFLSEMNSLGDIGWVRLV